MYLTKLICIGMLPLFLSCYTQFVAYETSAIPETISTVVDSTGDTVKVINRTDTVHENDREVCVWERDLLGYPRLHCYKTNYPRNWFLYSSTPWWYRSDPYWYDFDHCPRYYYYDSDCGCCRYSGFSRDYYHHNRYDHDHYYNHNGGGSGSNGGGSSGGGSPSKSTAPAQNKNTRTTAKPIKESAQTQQSSGTAKASVEAERPAEPSQFHESGDSSETVKQRIIRSPRGR